MSLAELKLTILEDYCKKNENKWRSEYIDANWPISELLKTKGKLPLVHRVGKKI